MSRTPILSLLALLHVSPSYLQSNDVSLIKCARKESWRPISGYRAAKPLRELRNMVASTSPPHDLHESWTSTPRNWPFFASHKSVSLLRQDGQAAHTSHNTSVHSNLDRFYSLDQLHRISKHLPEIDFWFRIVTQVVYQMGRTAVLARKWIEEQHQNSGETLWVPLLNFWRSDTKLPFPGHNGFLRSYTPTKIHLATPQNLADGSHEELQYRYTTWKGGSRIPLSK